MNILDQAAFVELTEVRATVFKLRSKLVGKHIHTTIFSGEENQTLTNIGTLIQDVGEWQLFGALLQCGSTFNEATRRDSLVVFEGDKQIIEQLQKEALE